MIFLLNFKKIKNEINKKINKSCVDHDDFGFISNHN